MSSLGSYADMYDHMQFKSRALAYGVMLASFSDQALLIVCSSSGTCRRVLQENGCILSVMLHDSTTSQGSSAE